MVDEAGRPLVQEEMFPLTELEPDLSFSWEQIWRVQAILRGELGGVKPANPRQQGQ